MSNYPSIFQPRSIGGLTLKNGIVFAPTTMGLPKPEHAEKLRRIAASGVALLVLGDISIEPTFHETGFHLHTPEGCEETANLVELLHSEGAKVSAQLFGGDYDVREVMTRLKSGKFSPDEVREYMNEAVVGYVTDMPEERIEQLLERYAAVARAACEAGFDMMQIHGDRLNGSFSSGVFNHREDRWGGSVQGRAQFACAVVQAVRQAVGAGVPIEYKLAVRQAEPKYGNAGVLLEELPVFVPLLEKNGVDSFHVSLANHSALMDTIPVRQHPYFKEEGCFLPYADAVRALTRLPVCGVGKLHTPAFIEQALASGRIQFAAMSRQLNADDQWLEKVAGGRESEIRTCVYCNRKCAGALQRHEPFGCVLS